MNHDITFCANGENCPHKKECVRATPPFVDYLAFSNFYKKDEKCEFFIKNSK